MVPDATLINAMIGFCHTNLAHNRPDTFDLEGIMRAFHNHPDISLRLVRLFQVRFDRRCVATPVYINKHCSKP